MKKVDINKYLPFIAFLGVYFFAYAPYFLFYSLPDIQQDCYIYFWAASLIRDGHIPFPRFTIDVPVGHPAFVWAVKSLFNKTTAIVTVQNVFYLLVSLRFIKSFSKIGRPQMWLSSIAIGLFSVDNFTMRINTALYTESIYISSLILIASNIVMCSYSLSGWNIVMLIASLLIPGLIRPNGFYVFFIPFILLFFFYQKGVGRSYYMLLFATTFFVFLAWSAVNYSFKGIFLPADPYRLSLVAHFVQDQTGNTAAYKDMEKKQPDVTLGVEANKPAKEKYILVKLKLFLTYITSFADTKPSFYFSVLPTRRDVVFKEKIYSDPNQLLFNEFRVDSAAPNLKKYLFGEIPAMAKVNSRIEQDCNLNSSGIRAKWLYANHVLYKLFNLFVANVLWVIAFFVLGVYCLYNFIKQSKHSSESFILINLFLLQVVSLIIITFGHIRFQLRYAHVTTLFVMSFVLLQGYYVWKRTKKNPLANAE